jgi:peroxiredoxin/tetratricopeptide (TPR) repeat protein
MIRVLPCALPLLVSLALLPLLPAQRQEPEPQEIDVADGDPPAGHSGHGVAFNEGPRQKAYIMAGCGDVHFAVTTDQELTQKFFDQGVGQLHGFWHFEAERSFRQAAKIDPNCAMAYWGMAMANVDNPTRAAGFIEAAVRRRDRGSHREQLWIQSLADYYEVTAASAKAGPKIASADKTGAATAAKKRKFKASKKDRSVDLAESYEQIVEEFPDDIEALAFLVNRVWLNRRARISTKNYDRMESLLKKIFEVNPRHPAHHYRIHLWDRKDAKRALISAAVSGQVSPAIAHQWHMSGHIFAKLNRHEDAVWQQSASARVDHAHMMRDRVMPYQIGNFGHNNEWLCRSLAHVGRARDALALAKNMIELPRHPEKNKLSKRSSIAGYGRTKLLETCRKFLWLDELRELDDAGYFDGDSGAAVSLAAAYYSMGDIERGKTQHARAKKVVSSKSPTPGSRSARRGGSSRVRGNGAPKTGDGGDRGDRGARRGRRRGRSGSSRARRGLKDLDGLLALAEGRLDDARKSLERSSMSKIYLADTQLALGETKAARKLIDAEAKRYPNRAEIMARQVRIHAEDGAQKSARKIFDELRTIAGHGDIDLPLFTRLGALAKSFDYPEDWRTPAAPRADSGVRPNVDELGPFRWRPSRALDWELPTSDGTTIRLSETYKGKPVLVVFYLGFGCLHCVEQLQAFHPMADRFRKAGIEIVAIGSDAAAGMKKSLDDLGPEDRFAFPLVADPELKVFKEWRAFDDFENMTLHGTFLVDGEGMVRWQDISYEPFNEPEWLLKECQRLLKLGK